MNKSTIASLEKSTVTLDSLLNLKGRVALVTGGAGWLGTAISETLAELGAHVFIASRDEQAARKTALEISQVFEGSRVDVVPLVVDSEESVIQCMNSVIEKAGRLDVLVNNAFSGTAKPMEATSFDEWKSILDIGLTGYYLCMMKALPHMKEQGGSIINVGSMYGMVSPNFSVYEGTEFNSSPAYGAAKAGVIQLTRYAACSLAKYNIRVNALSPGPFPSPKVRETKKFIDALSQKNPMGRMGDPWELKGPVAFLASNASSFVTGQNIVVDGGWTAW